MKSLCKFPSLDLILPCGAVQSNHTKLFYIVETNYVSVFCTKSCEAVRQTLG